MSEAKHELNPDRPLPWKAVQIGGVWDVTNDAGNPSDEFSVFEYATEGEAKFIVRACNAHADLLAALEELMGWSHCIHTVELGEFADTLSRCRAAIAKATGAA